MRINAEIWKQGTPPAAGFYAVLVSWEAIAGNVPGDEEFEDGGEIFPAGLYWNAELERWDADDHGGRTYDPVIRYHGPFETQQAARTFSWENEPGRPGDGMTASEAGDLEEDGEI